MFNLVVSFPLFTWCLLIVTGGIQPRTEKVPQLFQLKPQGVNVTCIDPESMEVFAREVKELYLQAKTSLENPNADSEHLNAIWIKMEAAVQHLRRIQWALEISKPCPEDLLYALIGQFKVLESRMGALIETFSCLVPFLTDELKYRAPVTATGSVGRPSYIITREQLEIMCSYSLSWIDIAKALGVSVSTIWRRRVYFKLDRRRHKGRRELTTTQLKAKVAEIKERAADAGIVMIEGELVAQGLYASRAAISEALMTLDPIGAKLRWRDFTPRVKYNVPGPNSLWHLDGNHKLIKWRMVIHGGIDGYSRLVVFLKCSDNNRAETVGNLFLAATENYCWPSRVRTDKGGENAVVARLMIEKRGEGRGSILQGSSVHNQRIERLWRDMRKMVTEYYRRLFYFLENNFLLDLTGETDLLSLHFVFIPRINRSLHQFRDSWNNHKLSTEGQKTPNQLYILGMLRLFGSNYTAVRDFFDDNRVGENYGISEPEEVDASSEEANNMVVVPEIGIQLPADCIRELQASIDPLEQDGNHGISLYLKAREIITRFTQTE